MDIFEFAIQMELDGRRFYIDLAGRTQDRGLCSIEWYHLDEF